MSDLSHNDQPIATPSEDRFGIDAFAAALATSIRKLQSPTGSVIALNGPWGSGKSSALNLIRHHLRGAVEASEIAVIDFTCWWFRGEEALALAFFRELYAGLSPTLGERLKNVLPKLGARLLRAGSVVGGAVDLAGGGGAGNVVGSAMDWLGGLIQQEESVEKLHGELSKALADQPRRFLIVIDDIDRLSPDEALLIFRLVKSVGRLPNVMYLLVYDRQLAEKIVSDRFPSEGPHYLEKIVQAAFELPEPLASDLQSQLLARIEGICGTPKEDGVVRFMNLFYEGVAPEMRTPRDVARFTNSLSVTWPAVADEVDEADFVVLEVIRLLHPDLYRAIRQNKDRLCGASARDRTNREDLSTEYDSFLLRSADADQNKRHRRTLMRLFPALESVWGNMSYSSDSRQQWASERRVCSPGHFESYFRFAVGSGVLSAKELEVFIANASDIDFVASEMRRAVLVTRPGGGTKAAVILDELHVHAERIGKTDVQPLLTGLFAVSDEIDVEADKGRGFSFDSNELRLHWLLRRLTRDRKPIAERSELLVSACRSASLGWLASLAYATWREHHPRDGKESTPEEQRLTTPADAQLLQDALHSRITAAARDGTLIDNSGLLHLLHRWMELAADDGAAVREWTGAQMEADAGIRRLAIAFTSYGWSQGLGFAGLGDLVAKRTTRAQVGALDKILDVPAFRRRVEQVSMSADAPEVSEFLRVWERQEQGQDD
jgi:predicted KAP-like P-loop ATPase